MTAPTTFGDGGVFLYAGDCIEVMRSFPDGSLDAIVTDPPYGLGFMGKEWDDLPPGLPWAQECLRVIRPGGHLLAFGGTRTWHRLAVAVEDAGFEIRDSIAWLYGSGFPKSMNVGKAITAHQLTGGSSRVQNRRAMTGDDSRSTSYGSGEQTSTTTATSAPPPLQNLTEDGQQWAGWGTALKPAFEPIVVGRKPLVGTVAANVLAHGTGALNIDACRVGDEVRVNPPAGNKPGGASLNMSAVGMPQDAEATVATGRWPANVVLDEDAAAELDEQSGTRTSGKRKPGTYRGLGYMGSDATEYPATEGSTGGASRFFYCAKAPTSERVKVNGVAHPTVKPLALMRWLLKLVTPPGGVVLDPFAGSGTTLEAAVLEGIRVVGIERDATYLPLIEARMARNGLTAPEQEQAAA
jgi:hypothetical protein